MQIDKMLQGTKKIAVIGDTMQDEWIHGKLLECQDGCSKFVCEQTVTTPGGAGNAANSLANWDGDIYLFGPEFPKAIPIKRRFLNDFNQIAFRHDKEPLRYGLSSPELIKMRDYTVRLLRTTNFDAVLICDYDKGFVDGSLISSIVAVCKQKNIPCVVDPKRDPECCHGAVLKCNDRYLLKNLQGCRDHVPSIILTLGADYPLIFKGEELKQVDLVNLHGKHEPCINHVGAGDCFAAHLTLALAHGIPLRDAAMIAHASGQVYVQHPHNRPPWPHEIRKQLDPVGGKQLSALECGALRKSVSGRIIFTNGVFRIPHAGHAWLLNWCKQAGDTVVVGINDAASAAAMRPGKFVLPLDERVEILASMSCVDWIVPFAEPDPCAILRELRPDVLVKGQEYAGQRVPGDDIVKNVNFAPASPYPKHSTDIAPVMEAE